MPPDPSPSGSKLRLTRREHKLLTRGASSVTFPYRDVIRARIILLAHRGWSDPAIAEKLRVDPRTVRTWVHRFLRDGLEGLRDRPRPGHRRVYSDAERALAKAIACELPSRQGAALARLSFTELTREVAKELHPAPSRSALHRWLQEANLQPWRSQYWKRPRDPEFGPKAARVIDLYHRMWEGCLLDPGDVVLCMDEKTCIAALERQMPTQPPAPGRPLRVEAEYAQKGVAIYVAALNMGNGQVVGSFPKANNRRTFMDFFEKVMDSEPCRSALRVFVILDNGPSHDPRTFPIRVGIMWPKVHLAYTPKHGSWLDAVEQYFSAVERLALTPNDLPTPEAVKERVRGFEERHNRYARAPQWEWTKEEMKDWLRKLEEEQGLNLGSSLIPA